jgi:HSP20 family protein
MRLSYNDDNNEIGLFSERVDEMISGVERSLFDLDSMSLEPLLRVEVSTNQVVVTFDLPFVEKKDIALNCSQDTLSIKAKTRKPVSIKIGGAFQKHFQFEEYSTKIRLPVSVDCDKGKAKFTNGLLVIRFPVAHQGNVVKVD